MILLDIALSIPTMALGGFLATVLASKSEEIVGMAEREGKPPEVFQMILNIAVAGFTIVAVAGVRLFLLGVAP